LIVSRCVTGSLPGSERIPAFVWRSSHMGPRLVGAAHNRVFGSARRLRGADSGDVPHGAAASWNPTAGTRAAGKISRQRPGARRVR
jgi:hypothetical protein